MLVEDMLALEICPALKRRWGRQLRKSLRSVLLRQTPDWVDVQLSFRNGAQRYYYLGFICSGEEPVFDPEQDIVDNAQLFLQLDAITLSQCIRGLFRRTVTEKMEAACGDKFQIPDWYLCPF